MCVMPLCVCVCVCVCCVCAHVSLCTYCTYNSITRTVILLVYILYSPIFLGVLINCRILIQISVTGTSCNVLPEQRLHDIHLYCTCSPITCTMLQKCMSCLNNHTNHGNTLCTTVEPGLADTPEKRTPLKSGHP